MAFLSTGRTWSRCGTTLDAAVVRPEGVRAGAAAVLPQPCRGLVWAASRLISANPGTWFFFVTVCRVPCKFITSSRKAEREVSSCTLFVSTWSQALKQQPR